MENFENKNSNTKFKYEIIENALVCDAKVKSLAHFGCLYFEDIVTNDHCK